MAENDDSYEIDGCNTCDEILPRMPDEWYQWSLGVSVGFVLTPNTCVYGKLFREYSASSMTAALEKLFAPENQDIFVGYRFYARGFVPAYAWYASWPLARCGSIEPTDTAVGGGGLWSTRFLSRGVRHREKMQGAAPWEFDADDTLVEVWNDPVNVYGSQTVKMLRVGGRSVEDAVHNWNMTARAIRSFKRGLALKK